MSQPTPVYLRDYTPPPWRVETVALEFELAPHATRVRARLALRRHPNGDPAAPLVLDGEGLQTQQVVLDGRELAAGSGYRIDGSRLTVLDAPSSCVVETEVVINPQANTALEGLYRSSGNYCTQCEAEGFRRITWYPDRPDVMARFTVRITADRVSCPVLLSNGNRLDGGELADGRHWALWEDPWPKPAYLFALVAGDLVCIEDRFTTASGRAVALEIYVQARNRDRCAHAMAALKKAMRWDEQRYGREYDLDRYMIVAVDDFNMGAMENKGLNLFNASCILADAQIATDRDYETIEAIIAHEYFHNWTGNRITCRDWFQLSLKEGLTVFRDQQFTAETTSEAVKRIRDVTLLRTRQFAEDAGPMAHPVRPDHYIEINNFYTMTVYEKGAELVRMLYHLAGPEGFRRGCDRYFERHDGQAVTCDDFVAAIADANGLDLSAFMRWYDQAGTPVVRAQGHFDAATQRYTLELSQQTPPTPGQPHKRPLPIPLRLGLVGPDGADLPLRLEDEAPEAVPTERVVELREAQQRFVFTGIEQAPRPSLLRGFSAPVRLAYDDSDDDLLFLLAHDSDPFNRWEAGQRFAVNAIMRRVAGGGEDDAAQRLAAAFARLLDERAIDAAFVAEAVALPDALYLAEQLPWGEAVTVYDPQAIHAAREGLHAALAELLRDTWQALYQRLDDATPYRYDAEQAGRRALKNRALGYLSALDGGERLAVAQYERADNMTDRMAALTLIADSEQCAERERVLDDFLERWRGDAVVMEKWFAVQAASRRRDTLERVGALLEHSEFDLHNPNKVRAVLGTFALRNPVRFHDPSGAGYALLAEQIVRLNAINPQIAARLVTPLGRWRQLDAPRGAQMRAQLEDITAAPQLARDVHEMVTRALA